MKDKTAAEIASELFWKREDGPDPEEIEQALHAYLLQETEELKQIISSAIRNIKNHQAYDKDVEGSLTRALIAFNEKHGGKG